MRNTKIENVLFPVEMRPIFFETSKGKVAPIDSHRVVINTATKRPLGVVSGSYRLVTNQEALGFARQCASQLFTKVKPEDLEVFNVYAPDRLWCCHIDLIHKGYEVNVFKQELYLPFLRVSNSYNATRALRFDIGYCRKLCLNGVIFESQTIEFRFTHSQASIGKTLDFKIGKDRLTELEKRFRTSAQKLFGYTIPDDLALPMFYKALTLPIPPSGDDVSPERVEYHQNLRASAAQFIALYFDKLGKNAYALFNAATDFASHPPDIKYFHRSQHAMQTGAGRWAHEITDMLEKTTTPDLSLYLADYLKAFSGRN